MPWDRPGRCSGSGAVPPAAERGPRWLTGPRSSRCRAVLAEVSVEDAVAVGVVGHAVVPAAPVDGSPGVGEDANGVRVAHAAGAGSDVEVGGLNTGPRQSLGCTKRSWTETLSRAIGPLSGRAFSAENARWAARRRRIILIAGGRS